MIVLAHLIHLTLIKLLVMEYL